jgi:hypothetical protein
MDAASTGLRRARSTRECGRAAYCTCLENRRSERALGFKSLHSRKGRCSMVMRSSPSPPGFHSRTNNYSNGHVRMPTRSIIGGPGDRRGGSDPL